MRKYAVICSFVNDVRNLPQLSISVILFVAMLILYTQLMHAGIFHLDMLGLAAYAEYTRKSYNPVMEKEYLPYDEGQLPWRTGNAFLTKAVYKAGYLFYPISGETAAFLTQFIFGALACVFLFLFLANEFKDWKPALACALLFSLSAPIFTAVLAKDQGTELGFTMLAMFLLSKGIEKESYRYFVGASTALGMLLWMREITILFPLIFFGFFVMVCMRRQVEKQKQILTAKNIASLIVPYIIFIVGALVVYAKDVIVRGMYGLNAHLFTYTEQIFMALWFWYGPIFLLLIFFGVYSGIKHKEEKILFFCACILFFLILFTKNMTFDVRQLGIYVLFPSVVVICYGIHKMQPWKKNIAIIIIIILSFYLFSLGLSINMARAEHVFEKEFAQKSGKAIPKNSVIFAHGDFCLFFMYYGNRFCESMPSDQTDFIKKSSTIIMNGTPVYVLYHAGFGFYDYQTRANIEEYFNLNSAYTGTFENYHHADLVPRIYEEILVEVTLK